MKYIRVTGGYSDYVSGYAFDELGGQSLVDVPIKVTLVLDGEDLPDADSDAWVEPAKYLSGGRLRVSMLVNEENTPVGNYWFWALPIDTPTKTPVRASDHLIVVT
jgi:hypothetical protein